MSEYTREEISGLALVGRMRARPGKRDELLDVLDEMVSLCSRHEPDGALTAVFHTSPADPDAVVLYEHYPSRASLDEHRRNYERIPAYGEIRARMDALLTGPVDIVEAARPVVRFARAVSGAGVDGAMVRREANLQLVRRLYEADNAHNPEAYGACLAIDVEVWGNGRLVRRGRGAQVEHMHENYTAFPDWQNETLALVADGDVVVARTHGSGTHSATFVGVPATGRRVEFFLSSSYEIRHGLIQRHWFDADTGSLRDLVSPAE